MHFFLNFIKYIHVYVCNQEYIVVSNEESDAQIFYECNCGHPVS